MESPEQESSVLYPTEAEIKSHFPDDLWNTMAEYERTSYRNMLHNYYVMESLGLKPKRPAFMSSHKKKAASRKTTSSLCQVPANMPETVNENPLKKEEKVKVQTKKGNRKEIKQKKANTRNKKESEHQKKRMVVIDSDHKWKSIILHCVFSTVFKVYKRYHGIIKGHFLQKQKTLRVSKKYLKNDVNKKVEPADGVASKDGDANVVEESSDKNDAVNVSKNNAKISQEEKKISPAKTSLEKTKISPAKTSQEEKKISPAKTSQEEKKISLAKTSLEEKKISPAKTSKEEKKISPEVKMEGQCAKQSKSFAFLQKPLCRSVQTITVAEGCSPCSASLVYVNAATCKMLSGPLPDPSPLTPHQRKMMKKIKKEKMKNCRSIQTQTAEENTSVEKASLVFLPKLKPKKPKPPVSTTQSGEYSSMHSKKPTVLEVVKDPMKELLHLQDSQPDKSPSADANTSVAVNPPSARIGDGISAPPADGSILSTKDKPDDGTSDDEFGFWALAKENSDSRLAQKPTTSKGTELPNDDKEGIAQLKKRQEDKEDRRYPRRAVPAVNYTEAELLQDDEYLFCDFCDREYEGTCPDHGPHTVFPDRFVPVTGDVNRAEQTTPVMLRVSKSKIPGAGRGVWTMLGLPPHVRFGPYEGEETPEPDPLGYSWAIVKDKRVDHYIAAQSTATSNWMRFVNCARHESEQNLMAFQYKGQMYYRTVKLIPPKSELFVWYGKEYAELLGISMERFRSKDTSHLRDLVFPCSKCSVTYTSPLYLEQHEKRCRGERTVSIVEPARVPTDVQTLAVVVDGKRTFCCNLCSYKTTLSANMKLHLVTHSGERPHVCDVCGKGFTIAGSLDRHKRIHTGDKVYKCDQCPYASSDRDNLGRHLAIHTGEKVFACPDCDYKTAHSGHLASHMRTHTGEKPHACPHCQYRAAHKVSLNNHIVRSHLDHN